MKRPDRSAVKIAAPLIICTAVGGFAGSLASSGSDWRTMVTGAFLGLMVGATIVVFTYWSPEGQARAAGCC